MLFFSFADNPHEGRGTRSFRVSGQDGPIAVSDWGDLPDLTTPGVVDFSHRPDDGRPDEIKTAYTVLCPRRVKLNTEEGRAEKKQMVNWAIASCPSRVSGRDPIRAVTSYLVASGGGRHPVRYPVKFFWGAIFGEFDEAMAFYLRFS